MINPEVSVVTVGTTPQLVFSGCGSVDFRIATSGGAAQFGDSALAAGIGTSWFQLNYADSKAVEFKADAEVYAKAASGTCDIRIVRWF